VVAVIINHFNKDMLPSGYLGVDIFFVISGYVITSSLAGRESKSFLDFLNGFYERRIKRLVPALFVFALITSVLICMFNPNPDWALKTGATSLFGLSNLYLLKLSTDYFAPSTELNPFTHTWSLGVEEQFYLLFPFLIWFSGFGKQTLKGARNLFFWVGTLTIASLIGFIYMYQVNQPAAYFLMPTRFWEMAAGCLLFIGFQKRARIEQALEQVPPLLIVAAMVGVMLLPVSAAVPATIGIVMLSSILIACLKKGTAAYQFFTLQKVTFVGLISYSLYLWHWTVLSISRWTIGIHWWSVPIQVGLMLLVAAGSYQWIEAPLRRAKWSIQSSTTVCIGLLSSAGGFLLLLGFMRASASQMTFLGSKVKSDQEIALPNVPHKECNIFKDHPKAVELSSDCGEEYFKGRPTLYSLGDSHSEQFNEFLAEYARHNHYNYVFVWGNSCLFPSAVVREGDVNCFDRQRLVEQEMLPRIKENDIVFIGNGLYGSFNEKWIDGVKYYTRSGTSLNNDDAAEIFAHRFKGLAETITSKGAKVVLYIDAVQFPGLDIPGNMCKAEWFRPQWQVAKECFHDIREHLRIINHNYSWRHDWKMEKQRLSGMRMNMEILALRTSATLHDIRIAIISKEITPHITFMHSRECIQIFLPLPESKEHQRLR
jgi:peptidoglycan/LPS O-acetylase OafA/YrhL